MLLGVAASTAAAQDPTAGRCATPDSIAVAGNVRVDPVTIRTTAGLTPGTQLNFRLVQRALRAIYATGEFDQVALLCDLAEDGSRATLTIQVKERPVLSEYVVEGVDRLRSAGIGEKAELPVARPLDPAAVARAIHRIDSTYEKNGYYLARVRAETTVVDSNAVRLAFRVEEGRRLAISGIRVDGNSQVKDGDVVGAMKTKPEGFWWWRKGEFDDETYAADLSERLPALYAKRGLIDFRVGRDTLVVDRERGKGLIQLSLVEGEQYRVGSFESAGNRHFSSEDIRTFYPFDDEGPAFTSRVTDFLLRRRPLPNDVFDQAKWEDATNKVRTAYSNEGYIYASVRPVVERRVAADSTPYVDLRWEIEERSPAIINRVEIQGNDYTSETCIRDQLVILPGDVFSQDRLIRSWQSIGNLGFFETPLPPPDTRQANDSGDVDIIFRVKEKRTGNVNFGASMGQGTGVGGFIGLDQPNLFGQCKRGSLQWQFGRYFNDFNLSYTDPRIRQSQISGTVTAYRSLSRFTISDLGRALRTGGQLQVGLPVPNSRFSRLFVSYGGETVDFGTGGLLGDARSEFGNGQFRSTLGLTLQRDTRIDLPFPTAGSMQTASASFNGGPLGGTSAFQQYRVESSVYAPLAALGGGRGGSQPMIVVAGLTTRAGAVFGNTGPFYYSQEFALGGVQYGERLRGYEEFSISPTGVLAGTGTFSARRESFGKAFFTTTAEIGLRLNQALYLNMFYDAGNIWRHPRQIDPTRLIRGAGFGASTVTPLGPLGIDYAYGFDRIDAQGRPKPQWQLHFRLGQLF
jgi:outer membrane protein insertion porin family